MPKQRKVDSKGNGGGFGSYLAILLVLVCTAAFVAQHWLGVNITVSCYFVFLICFRALSVVKEEKGVEKIEAKDQAE